MGRRKSHRRNKLSGKKADVSDLSEAMAAASREAGKGGRVQDQADEDLFYVDTKPSGKQLPRKLRKKLAAEKVLAVDAKLVAPGLDIGATSLYASEATKARKAKAKAAAEARLREGENVARKAREKKAAKVARMAQAMVESGAKVPSSVQIRREAAARKAKARRPVPLSVSETSGSEVSLGGRIKVTGEVVDVWGEVAPEVAAWQAMDEFMREAGPYRLRKKRKLRSQKSLSAAVAVPTPSSGLSYNPDANDHARQLRAAAKIQMRKNKKDAAVERAMPGGAKAKIMGGRYTDVLMPVEMIDDEEGAVEIEVEPELAESVAEAVKLRSKPSKPKTKQQRKRQTKHKVWVEQARRARAERKKLGHAGQAKAYAREARRAAAKSEAVKAAKAKRGVLRREVSRMGPYVVPDEGEEFLLPQELPSSLRTLVPQVSSKDRALQWMKRGAVLGKRAKKVDPGRPWLKLKYKIHKQAEWAEHPLNDDDYLEDSSSGEESDIGDETQADVVNATRVRGYDRPSRRTSTSRGKRKRHHQKKK